ncbi:MAG: (d)CMP kinase [archaeon]
MQENPVITIGGPPGAGSTSIAHAVANEFELRYFSTGKAFRKIAEERGISVKELSDTAEEGVDKQVDELTKEEARQGGVVMESKLAAWITKEVEGCEAIRIWLEASVEARAQRVLNDEKERIAEAYETVEDVQEQIRERWTEDKRRYREFYGYDLDDMSVYDLVIDTNELGLDEVKGRAIEFLREKLG